MENKFGLFICKKCGHRLYVVLEERTAEDLVDLLSEGDCPNCGENPSDNWIFSGVEYEYPEIN